MGGGLLGSLAGCHRTPPPDVVATVNGKDIPRAELERQYQIVKLNQGDSPQDPSPEQASMARLVILRQLIDEEILQQRAASLNVAASDEDVNAALTEKKLPYTKEEFDKHLKDLNETLDDFTHDLRHSLTVSKLMNKEVDSKINITDAEIANYFTQHKAEWNYIEPRYNIARIVVFNAGSAQAASQQTHKAPVEADSVGKIKALHKRLEGGEDFGEVAMNFSEDKDSASNGGNMGFVYESQLREGATQEVYDAITKLKPGQYTDVLPINGGPTPNHKPVGYAIYRVLARDAAGQRTLDDVRVKAAIREKLRDDHGQLLRNAYIETLRDGAKVHNYLADQILKGGAK